jgi:hypothetical protein
VAYVALAATEKRSYLSIVTTLDPAWLSGAALARVSAPLTTPPPVYSRTQDMVVAWHEAAYGMHAWPLPLCPGEPAANVTVNFGLQLKSCFPLCSMDVVL